MEDHVAKDRLPSLSRVASRTSTSSSNTRVASQSTNSSGSLHGVSLSSPQSPEQPHTHRSHASCRIEQLRSQCPTSEVAAQDWRPLQPTLSSFLREKLQRERKAETERSSSRMGSDTMGSTMEPGSPLYAASTARRPRSSESDEAPKHKGFGLKEMEQTLSKLHKQNFDLKFELSHRREKQIWLERRVEELEREKMRVDELEKDKADLLLGKQELLSELKTRDKAIEEAVAMIVALEARVDQLMQMAGRNETSERVRPARAMDEESELATPKVTVVSDRPRPEKTRVITKMPSFLSERTENTETLRNVYLGSHGSLLSLSRAFEDSQDMERHDLNVNKSPSLSVLSESSFMSVYGRKSSFLNSTSPPDDISTLDEPLEDNHGLSEASRPAPLKMTPTKQLRRPESRSTSNGSMVYQNMNNMLGASASPLQRLEKLEASSVSTNEARRSISYGQEHTSSLSARTQTRPKTKQEKREALQRVLTDAPFQRPDALPPTPDTISTSTLRRFQQHGTDIQGLINERLINEHSFLALTETTASQLSLGSGQGNSPDFLQPHSIPQAALPVVLDNRNRQQLPEPFGFLERPFEVPVPPRPRSADATTISRRRRRNNGWDSDTSEDDDDFLDGAGSVASSFDYWMRESQKPNRSNANALALDPASSASQAGTLARGVGRTTSPDLFSFPSNGDGWAPEAMFSSSRGPSDYLAGRGSGGGNTNTITPAPSSQTLDALGDSLPRPLLGPGFASAVLDSPGAGGGPPPPPNRRSSLAAMTGSAAVVIGANSPRRTVRALSAAPSPVAAPSPSPAPAPASSALSSAFMPSSVGKLRKSLLPGNRVRSNSIDVRTPHYPSQAEMTTSSISTGFGQNRSSTVPPKQQQPFAPPTRGSESPVQQPTQKATRHYPPTASQGPRSRTLSLFRRSMGTPEPVAAQTSSSRAASPSLVVVSPPSSAPATETTFNKNAVFCAGGNGSGRGAGVEVGVPSWGRRNNFPDDDERASVTPPPILRNKEPNYVDGANGGLEDGGASLESVTTPGNNSGGGGALVGVIPGTGTGTTQQGSGYMQNTGQSQSQNQNQNQKPPSTSSSGAGGGGRDNSGGGASLRSAPGTPTAPASTAPRPDILGGKRKWLGLGRVGSLRNRVS